jgi:hypothetical protein
VTWLREVLAGRDGQLAALRDDHSSLAAERDWLRATAADRERAFAALERERAWLRATIDADAARAEAGNELSSRARRRSRVRCARSSGCAKSAPPSSVELEWLRGVRADVERERDWLRATLEDARVARGELSQALEDAKRSSDDAHARRDELARRVEDLAREHANLEQHERWLRGASSALAELVLAGDVAPTSDIDRVLGDARGRAVAMVDELRWRREQMRAARADGGAVIRALVARSALGPAFRGLEREGSK